MKGVSSNLTFSYILSFFTIIWSYIINVRDKVSVYLISAYLYIFFFNLSSNFENFFKFLLVSNLTFSYIFYFITLLWIRVLNFKDKVDTFSAYFYIFFLNVSSNFEKFFKFLLVDLILGFFKKIYKQFIELHRSLSWFDKFFWYSIVLYMIFLVCLYVYFHYQLYEVNRKVLVLNSLIKYYYNTFKDRETLMIMIKYKMQDIARRRLWFARHLHECRHPFDDGRHYLIFRDFIPAPWAKYGSKR